MNRWIGSPPIQSGELRWTSSIIWTNECVLIEQFIPFESKGTNFTLTLIDKICSTFGNFIWTKNQVFVRFRRVYQQHIRLIPRSAVVSRSPSRGSNSKKTTAILRFEEEDEKPSTAKYFSLRKKQNIRSRLYSCSLSARKII